jgi:hypothetical protein
MSDIPEPLRSLLADDRLPKSGSVWRRHDGRAFRVVTLSSWQPQPEVVLITLRSLSTGACETLPLADFLAPVEVGGGGIPRYRPD